MIQRSHELDLQRLDNAGRRAHALSAIRVRDGFLDCLLLSEPEPGLRKLRERAYGECA